MNDSDTVTETVAITEVSESWCTREAILRTVFTKSCALNSKSTTFEKL